MGSSNFYGRNGIKFYSQVKTVMSNWGWMDDVSLGMQPSCLSVESFCALFFAPQFYFTNIS